MQSTTNRCRLRAGVVCAFLSSFVLVQGFVPMSTGHGLRGFSLHSVSSTSIRPVDNTETVPSKPSSPRPRRRGGDIKNPTNDKLENLGLPFGLRQVLLQSLDLYQKRIWIIDNSGSMTMHDGHQILHSSGAATNSCTRWQEVQETVHCHSMLAAEMQAPTDFRLLNAPPAGPQQVQVGYGRHAVRDCQRVQSCLSRHSPSGQTPLAAAVTALRDEVIQMLPQLQAQGRKVAICLATDGCNHDKSNVGHHVQEVERNQELLAALKSLQGLPVTVTVRLCTDYQAVTHFYDTLDESLSAGRFGIDMDVLDDHQAEAAQVAAHNPWLNYALVLHRIREMGQDDALFDLLDERPFTRAEIKQFCTLLFGRADWPDDWMQFLQAVHAAQEQEKPQINPRTGALEPWIDVRQLFIIGCYWSDCGADSDKILAP